MRRKNHPQPLKWASLAFLLLLMPLLLPMASEAPVGAGKLPLAAMANLSITPLVETASFFGQLPTPEATATPTASVGDMVFTDTIATETAQLELTATEPPAPPPTEPPRPETDEWSYENDAVRVTITRHKEEGFVYFAANIQLTRPDQFSFAFSNEKYNAHTEALSDIAERHNPLLAINGDYYSFHDNGIIIRDGKLYRKNKSARALLVVDANGDLSVISDRSDSQSQLANRLISEGVLHTFEFGPILVESGEAVPLKSAILRVTDEHLEPRTAIGQLGPLHYLVIVVDGRSPGYSEGVSLSTLQRLFTDRGATVAFNLDGGGSTTLWFNGGVINRPASGDERKVSDIVMFLRD